MRQKCCINAYLLISFGGSWKNFPQKSRRPELLWKVLCVEFVSEVITTTFIMNSDTVRAISQKCNHLNENYALNCINAKTRDDQPNEDHDDRHKPQLGTARDDNQGCQHLTAAPAKLLRSAWIHLEEYRYTTTRRRTKKAVSSCFIFFLT